MVPVDILPPSAPTGSAGGERKGFFSKLFRKKGDDAYAASDEFPAGDELSTFDGGGLEDETFDIDDIRRKLGLDEERRDAPRGPENRVPPPPPITAAQTERKGTTSETMKGTGDEDADEPIAIQSSYGSEERELPEPKGEPSGGVRIDDWTEAADATGAPGTIDDHVSSDWAAPAPAGRNDVTKGSPAINEWDEVAPDESSPDEPAPDRVPPRQRGSPQTGNALPSEFEEEPEIPESLDDPEDDLTDALSDATAVPPALVPVDDAGREERAQERPGEDLLPPAEEPAEPIDLSGVADIHFKELEEEHAQLAREIEQVIATPRAALPDTDHPLEKGVAPGKEFILKNGQPLRSFKELMEALELIDDETFQHHVTAEKNDFANWVQHVLDEEKLAESIRNKRAKQELLKILKSHERTIEKRLAQEGGRIESLVAERRGKVQEAEGVEARIDELKRALAEKSALLADQRKLLTEEVQSRLAERVEAALKKERLALERLSREAERKRSEYEKRLQVMKSAFEKRYETREKRVKEQEERLKQKQESLKRVEASSRRERDEFRKEQKAEHERLERERADAEAVIKEAAAVKEQLASLTDERLALEKERDALTGRLEKEKERLASEKETLNEEKRTLAAKQASLMKQENGVKSDRAALNKREQEMTKQEAILQKAKAEMKSEQAESSKRQKALKQEERDALKRIAESERKAAARIKQAEEAERLLEEKLQERRKIADYIVDAEKSLKEHQKRAKAEGMHDYLNERLSAIEKEPSVPRAENVRNLKIYAMIDKSREALQADDLKEARKLYNRIREAFNAGDLNPSEKSVLYTTIRELYDDIHLASLK